MALCLDSYLQQHGELFKQQRTGPQWPFTKKGLLLQDVVTTTPVQQQQTPELGDKSSLILLGVEWFGNQILKEAGNKQQPTGCVPWGRTGSLSRGCECGSVFKQESPGPCLGTSL